MASQFRLFENSTAISPSITFHKFDFAPDKSGCPEKVGWQIYWEGRRVAVPNLLSVNSGTPTQRPSQF
jgi:hypothetical protein